jgi:hypothetical protein
MSAMPVEMKVVGEVPEVRKLLFPAVNNQRHISLVQEY